MGKYSFMYVKRISLIIYFAMLANVFCSELMCSLGDLVKGTLVGAFELWF